MNDYICRFLIVILHLRLHPPLLPRHPIALDPTPIKRPIILQPKLAPIIRQPIITPIPLPSQLVIACPAARTLKTQQHLVHVLWGHTSRFHNERAFLLGGGVFCFEAWDRRAGETPAAEEGVFHGCRGQRAVRFVHVLDEEVGDDVRGFAGREQADAGAVAQEAEVAVVCHDVDGRVPGDGGGRGLAGACVVDGANVAAVEADAGAALEEGAVGWVDGGDHEGHDGGLGGRWWELRFGFEVEIWIEGLAAFSVDAERFAVDSTCEGVVHRTKAIFIPCGKALPDTVFGNN